MPETASAEAPGRPGETLRASSVSRSFEGVQALRDVTLELRRREVVGLIGPNGAGKSTLVNVLTGFDRPDEGSVELEGREITGWSPQRRARAGLARTFQHSRSFRGLTVRENVEVAALGAGTGPREARRRADRLLDLLGLAGVAGRGAAELAQHDAGMLLIDHNMALVMGASDRIHVLDQGRTLAAGTPVEIRGNLDVAAAYLGETAVHETGG